MNGYDKLWFIGDNFFASTYRTGFKNASWRMNPGEDEEDIQASSSGKKDPNNFFIKEQFDFKPFCNSRYESPQKNLLTRITDTFTEAVNKNGKLLKFIIFILDDDIIQFTKFDKAGVATLFGRYLQFIIDEVKAVIEERKSQLPKKAIKVGYPVVYWLAAPCHSNWHND